MSVRFVAMRRRDGMTQEDFRHHWRHIHGALMARVPGVLYSQNSVTRSWTHGITREPAGLLDGFARIGFVTDDAMANAGQHASSRAAGADLVNFVGASDRLICDVETIIPPPAAATGVKRIDIVRLPVGEPRGDVDSVISGYGIWAALRPAIIGLRINRVTETLAVTNPAISGLNLDAAAFVEIWFGGADASQIARTSADLPGHDVDCHVVEEVAIAP